MDKPAAPPTPAWLPYGALLLILAIIATLVWLTRSYDEEVQRTTLISDVLWMEQNLRFHLDRNAAQLGQLGPALIAGRHGDVATEAGLRHLLRAESGLARIIWTDADGTMRGAQPPASDDHLVGESGGTVPARSIFRLARAIGRPVYGPAYPITGGDHHFEVHVPIYSDGAFIGTAVGVYSLQSLVVRELPWWFSERYRVSVLDSDGQELAAKSGVGAPASGHDYSIAFDPPGHGLVLHIAAHRGEIRWIPLLLVASLVMLGSIIVWSIWQLRRQLQRRQAAEHALHKESTFRKAMEDSLLTGLRARDLSGRVTYVNPAFCRMVGYSAEELVGHLPPMPYWDPEHLERTQELHELIMAGGTPPEGMEVRLRRKDGSRLDAQIFEAPLIDGEGRHSGWMGSVLDITEQKRAEELARQQEERLQATSRLVTMGEMASTLAHELNQPLAAIASYNSGCINRLESGDCNRAEMLDIHQRIARQARRAGDIVRRVHDFVRRSEPKRIAVDLNAIIREAVELLEADTRKRQVRVHTGLSALPALDADPVMLEQIVVNLVRNAMDAMRDTPATRREVTISTRREGSNAVLQISDRGSGIPPETAARLFEPFFTTKAEGMGMGLNICRSIAELHHGHLGFEARPDGGTIFTLTLPLEPA